MIGNFLNSLGVGLGEGVEEVLGEGNGEGIGEGAACATDGTCRLGFFQVNRFLPEQRKRSPEITRSTPFFGHFEPGDAEKAPLGKS